MQLKGVLACVLVGKSGGQKLETLEGFQFQHL